MGAVFISIVKKEDTPPKHGIKDRISLNLDIALEWFLI